MSFFDEIWQVINCSDKEQKFSKFHKIYSEFKNGLKLSFEDEIYPLQTPCYSAFCEVVAMREMSGKKPKAKDKQKAFLHSIAHIEFSAIDIALDAVYRFRNLPREYYADWLEVADDEIRHFKMIESYLNELGGFYGEFVVHDGLFIALKNTENSLLERMAVLPRYMEANGLDANAFMLKKLKNEPENSRLVEILQVILDEEISHVSKGDRWFKFECERLKISPENYIKIVQKFYPKAFLQSRELNVAARLKSGFSQDELALIERICKGEI